MSTEIVSAAEMAQQLGVSVDKVRDMARSGKVPHLRPGKAYLFIPDEVIAALRVERTFEKALGVARRSATARRKVH